MAMTMHDLEVLDRIFQRDNAAVAVFEIDLPGSTSCLTCWRRRSIAVVKIPGSAAVHKTVAMGFDLLAERGVSAIWRNLMSACRSNGAAKPSAL